MSTSISREASRMVFGLRFGLEPSRSTRRSEIRLSCAVDGGSSSDVGAHFGLGEPLARHGFHLADIQSEPTRLGA